MAAATGSRAHITEFGPPSPARSDLPVAANQLYHKATLIAMDAAGRAVNPTDGDGFRVVGVAEQDLDNRTGSELGGAADVTELPLHVGVAGPFAAVGSGTLRPGDVAFSVDNQTVSADPESGEAQARGIAGRVISNRGGKVYLWVGPQVHFADTEADVAALEAAAADANSLAGAREVSAPIPLTAFSDGTTNGYQAAVFGFRFNDGIDNQPLTTIVVLPEDVDTEEDVHIDVIGYIVDDAVDDDVEWLVTARINGGADTEPAGPEGAGAILGEAADTKRFTIDSSDVAAGALHITARADNNLDTSDAVILGILVSYTRTLA